MLIADAVAPEQMCTGVPEVVGGLVDRALNDMMNIEKTHLLQNPIPLNTLPEIRHPKPYELMDSI